MLSACLLALLVVLFFINVSRRLVINTVRGISHAADRVCHSPIDPHALEDIALKFVQSFTTSTDPHPTVYILMGGPGSGKGRYISTYIDGKIMIHGLDEYLVFHPAYDRLFNDPLFVYPKAADSCYQFVIPLARRIRDLAISRRLSLVYEETGKDVQRLRDRVLAPFIAAGYNVVGVLVETAPDVAVIRAHRRFLVTGRFASPDYVRSSFPKVDEIEALFADRHTLIRCTNDCREAPGSAALAKAARSDCLRCS